MIKKILVIGVVMLVLSMTLTPLTFAKRSELKNNDKFLSFTATLVADWANQIYTSSRAPPEGMPNRLTISWNEIMLFHQIIIDERYTYNLYDNFTYTGFAVYTVWDPILPAPIGEFPTGRQVRWDINYMYNFTAGAGPLEGTLEMHAIAKLSGEEVVSDHLFITSMRGTGDLQNVNIKATGGSDTGFTHIGIVSGWPIPPP